MDVFSVDSMEQSGYSLELIRISLDGSLHREQAFCTPEAVLVYSVNGLSGMSNTFHKLYRTRVCRGWYRDRERPVLLNSWEGMYFEINEEKMLTLAEEAAELGIELLVMDDGWFKGRNTDTTSLGGLDGR